MGPEVSWRVDRTRVAFLAVAGRFFAAVNFSLKCKKSVAATLLETRLLYSSETWPPLSMGHARRHERVQMRWIRKAVKRHCGEGCNETDAQIRAEFSIATAQVELPGAASHGLSNASCTHAGRGHATPMDQGSCWRFGGSAGSAAEVGNDAAPSWRCRRVD